MFRIDCFLNNSRISLSLSVWRKADTIDLFGFWRIKIVLQIKQANNTERSLKPCLFYGKTTKRTYILINGMEVTQVDDTHFVVTFNGVIRTCTFDVSLLLCADFQHNEVDRFSCQTKLTLITRRTALAQGYARWTNHGKSTRLEECACATPLQDWTDLRAQTFVAKQDYPSQ